MRIPNFFQKGAFCQNVKTPAVILTGFFDKNPSAGVLKKRYGAPAPMPR